MTKKKIAGRKRIKHMPPRGRISQMRHNCHQMMKAMWGDDNRKAYIWLIENVGLQVHFSEIHDPDLLAHIQHALGARMRRKGLMKPPSHV